MTSWPLLRGRSANIAAWPIALVAPAMAADELCRELDGADVTVAGDGRWHIRVFSVVDDDSTRWVQLGLSGPSEELATLQVPVGAGGAAVNLALNAWFREHRIKDLA